MRTHTEHIKRHYTDKKQLCWNCNNELQRVKAGVYIYATVEYMGHERIVHLDCALELEKENQYNSTRSFDSKIQSVLVDLNTMRALDDSFYG